MSYKLKPYDNYDKAYYDNLAAKDTQSQLNALAIAIGSYEITTQLQLPPGCEAAKSKMIRISLREIVNHARSAQRKLESEERALDIMMGKK